MTRVDLTPAFVLRFPFGCGARWRCESRAGRSLVRPGEWKAHSPASSRTRGSRSKRRSRRPRALLSRSHTRATMANASIRLYWLQLGSVLLGYHRALPTSRIHGQGNFRNSEMAELSDVVLDRCTNQPWPKRWANGIVVEC